MMRTISVPSVFSTGFAQWKKRKAEWGEYFRQVEHQSAVMADAYVTCCRAVRDHEEWKPGVVLLNSFTDLLETLKQEHVLPAILETIGESPDAMDAKARLSDALLEAWHFLQEGGVA